MLEIHEGKWSDAGVSDRVGKAHRIHSAVLIYAITDDRKICYTNCNTAFFFLKKLNGAVWTGPVKPNSIPTRSPPLRRFFGAVLPIH